MTKPNVGFIGLGLMGSAMVNRMQDLGYPMNVIANVSRANVDTAVARGATEYATGRELAAASDVIMLCVDTSASVEGRVNGRAITSITLADIQQPADFSTAIPVNRNVADISVAADVETLFADKPDIIYHLAAVVSGAAEADLDLGLRVNLGGTMNILEAARKQGQSGTPPMVIYASSVAVHGGEAPPNTGALIGAL